MSVCRKPYPSDVSDEKWSLVAPYLLLQREGAGQREYDLREVFNGLRSIVKAGARWRGCRTIFRPGRWSTGRHSIVVDTLGHLLALHVTPASAEDRGAVERRARSVQAVTNDTVELARVDHGHTGERAAGAAARHGIALEVVKPPEAEGGFVLLPRRRVAKRSFAWATCFCRPVKDYERDAETRARRHVIAFACFMMKQETALAAGR